MRKAPDQMCETKFLQMCSFFIILTSLHSLNLSFPLLFDVISIPLYLSFQLDFLHPHTDFPHFFAFPPMLPAFPSHSSQSHTHSPHFPHSVPLIPHFGFYRQPAQFVIFNNLIQIIVALVQKRTLPFVMTSSVLSPKIIYLMMPQVKTQQFVKCEQIILSG